jgi:hypothetical protein
MEELIDAGADLNHANIDHDTVLHRAVRDRNLLAVAMLLERGAEVDDGNQGLDVSELQCDDPEMKALLHKHGVQFTDPDNYDSDNEDTRCDHCEKFEKNYGGCERVVKDSNGRVILGETGTHWQGCLNGGWSNDYETDLLLCPDCTDMFQRCCIKCGEKYSAVEPHDGDFSRETDWKKDKHGYWSCTDCQESKKKRKRNRKKKTSGKKKTSRKKSRK